MAAVPFSHCLGRYDQASTACRDEKMGDCYWVEKCHAYTRWLKKRKLTPENDIKVVEESRGVYVAVALKSRKEFLTKLKRIQENLYTRELRRVAHNRKPPSIDAFLSSRKSMHKTLKKKLLPLIEAFIEFKSILELELPSGVVFTKKGRPPHVGQMYVMDRVIKSRYASVYVKALRGRDDPLLLLRFKPFTNTFDAELPVNIQELRKHVPEDFAGTLRFIPFRDGFFRVAAIGLKIEEMKTLAKIIALLVNKTIIEIPRA